jgi:hypothetical protein
MFIGLEGTLVGLNTVSVVFVDCVLCNGMSKPSNIESVLATSFGFKYLILYDFLIFVFFHSCHTLTIMPVL